MHRGKAAAAVNAVAVCILAAGAIVAAVPGFTAQQNSDLQQQRNMFASEIVLPPQLETEKPATLAVLEGEGRLLSGVSVDLPEGRHVRTDSTGRARFVVTSAPGKFVAEVSTGSGFNGALMGAAEVISKSPGSSTDITISQVPRFAELSGRIEVRGAGFRGDADMNRVTIDGQPALVLAASPVSMVVVPGPNVAPGTAALQIEVAGKKCNPASVTFVSLSVEPQAIPIVEGKKNQLVVLVRGTDQKLMLAVENKTPDVIELAGGNSQRVRSSGGKRNRAVIEMRALRSADFSVVVKLAAERQ